MNNLKRTQLNKVTGFVPAVVRQNGVLRVWGLMSFICLWLKWNCRHQHWPAFYFLNLLIIHRQTRIYSTSLFGFFNCCLELSVFYACLFTNKLDDLQQYAWNGLLFLHSVESSINMYPSWEQKTSNKKNILWAKIGYCF